MDVVVIKLFDIEFFITEYIASSLKYPVLILLHTTVDVGLTDMVSVRGGFLQV